MQEMSGLDDKDSDLLKNFRNALNLINNIEDKTEFVDFFVSMCSIPRHKSSIQEFFMTIFEASIVIARNFDLVRNNHLNMVENILESVSLIFEIYSNKNESSILPVEIIDYLSSIFLNLQTIRTTKPPSEFIYKKNTSAGNSLDKYIQVANILKDDLDFPLTPFGKFEQLIIDPKKVFLDEIPKNVKNQYSVRNQNSKRQRNQIVAYDKQLQKCDFSTTFIAHVSPSFEGKTQSAFVLSTVRPLYFAIDQIQRNDLEMTTQPIYLNFESLSLHLSVFGRADLASIDSGKQIGIHIESISPSSLYLDYAEFPFMALGFLAHLIDDAESNFNPNDSSCPWMKFYADREGRVSEPFSPMTIKEFKSKLEKRSSKYCLFLDEFGSAPWMVFIRNLAICVNLRCIVANTNSSIVNIITEKINSSRVEGVNPWAVVINKLKPENPEVVGNVTKWLEYRIR